MGEKCIAIIGCGNLGMSIAQGLIDKPGFSAERLYLTRRNTAALSHFAANGAQVLTDNSAAAAAADIVILAVKPYNIQKVITEMNGSLGTGEKTIVSLASGVSISVIREYLDGSGSVFRVMPNIAAAVSESMSLMAHDGADDTQAREVSDIFNAVGKSITIDESLMEAATVLGACGIAYVMRFMRAMIQGGVQIGFSAAIASQIVTQTVLGAATMLSENDTHPEAEIDKVTTPKGCTIVGLNEMEHNGFSSSLIKGIVKSFDSI